MIPFLLIEDILFPVSPSSQEMEFMAGLVRVGKFKKEEMHSVLRMLFPRKSEEEVRELMLKLYDGEIPPTDIDEEEDE